MVECHYNGAIIFVPVKLFLSVTMRMKYEDSKYIRFKDGPRIYNLSENTFIKLAEDAKAAAEHSIWEIFQPMISNLSSKYSLKVEFK